MKSFSRLYEGTLTISKRAPPFAHFKTFFNFPSSFDEEFNRNNNQITIHKIKLKKKKYCQFLWICNCQFELSIVGRSRDLIFFMISVQKSRFQIIK